MTTPQCPQCGATDVHIGMMGSSKCHACGWIVGAAAPSCETCNNRGNPFPGGCMDCGRLRPDEQPKAEAPARKGRCPKCKRPPNDCTLSPGQMPCSCQPEQPKPQADVRPLREFWIVKYDYGPDKFEIYADRVQAEERYEGCGTYFPAQLIHVREVPK